MKFTYDFIKENLRIYNEAKSVLPIISQYENGEVSHNAMRTLNLTEFADFYNFINSEKSRGFELIQAVSFKELKFQITDKTKNIRFKKLFSNMSSVKFKKLLTEDVEKFDRYLNGRWISKPGYNSRGRRVYGRRSTETTDGLNQSFVPIINWIICNEIELLDVTNIGTHNAYQSFQNQDIYLSRVRWYKSIILTLDNIPKREIEVTSKLLKSLVDLIDDTEVDFRKLNSDFIIDTFQTKIINLMTVPIGTILVSLFDKQSDYGGRQLLTKGKNYIVEGSAINSGFVRVTIVDDSGSRNYFDYKMFEDISLQRDMLLSQLGII